MNPPAQVTTKHTQLRKAVMDIYPYPNSRRKADQLIADSEARAINAAFPDSGDDSLYNVRRLRAEVEHLRESEKAFCDDRNAQRARAERAEAELAKERARLDAIIAELASAKELLREIRDHEVNESDEADKFLRDHAPSELSKLRAELAKERAMIDWLQAQEIKRAADAGIKIDDDCPFLVLGEDGTTYWGKTYREAVANAMKGDGK